MRSELINKVLTVISIKMEQNVNFDNESLAYMSTRKDELVESHISYISEHPEIRQVLNDFISSVLLHKPVSRLTLNHTGPSLLAERCVCVREGVLPPV